MVGYLFLMYLNGGGGFFFFRTLCACACFEVK